jgi:hypothetical protein
MAASPPVLTVSDSAGASAVSTTPATPSPARPDAFATTFHEVLTHERRVLDEVAARLS